MARIEILYLPASSLLAGKEKLPLSSLTTVMVIVEPSFFALTSTPSMAPSSAEVTWPVSAAPDCASRGVGASNASGTIAVAASNNLRMRFSFQGTFGEPFPGPEYDGRRGLGGKITVFRGGATGI